MLAPVVLFVYNRVDHTSRVLETLGKNELAKDTELYVFSDAAKSDKGLDKVNAVREYINQKEWQKNFKTVTIVQAEKNKGLAKSVIGGVSEIIEKYGKVIVVEDDLILSPYFLNYMNGALDYYKEDSKIWAISGYSFPMRSLKNYPHDVFYSYRGSSWGWATWDDRWKKVDWEVSDYAALMSSQERQKQFNRGGSDLVNMLRLQMEGKIDSWAVRWVYAQSKLDTYTVYPKHSYLGNGGCDGSGTHSGKNDDYWTDIQMSSEECKFETLEIDKKLAREFWYKYSDTLDKKIKRNLKKTFGK
jgi:hypothetical protein